MYYKKRSSIILTGYLVLSSFNPIYAQEILSQSTSVSNSSTKSLERFNSSANPLLFPTKTQEVQIEEQQAVTLQDAIAVALRNNKDLQVARLQLDRSRDSLNASLASKLPTLNSQLELNQRGDDTPAAEGFTMRNRTLFSGQIEVSYNVYDGGRRDASIARSSREVYLNQLEVERISEDIRFRSTAAYYELQNADAQVAIAQAAIEDFSQTLRDAQLLEKAGLGTRFDVLQAQVDLANANQALTRAIAEQRNARRNLADILGVGQQVELTAADEIKESGEWAYTLEESIIMAYKNRAELQQLLVKREINEKNREIALAETRPNVNLFANYNFTNTFADTFDVTGYANGYNLGARLNWLIFDGGVANAKGDVETRNMEIEETNFAKQRDEIRLKIETAYNKMIANKENISTTETAVTTAVESLRLARLRFQAGVGTQTDVINAQRSLTEARGNFLKAIIGYNQSLNELQRAVSNLPDRKLFEAR